MFCCRKAVRMKEEISMETIKASNVWDDDYIPPGEKDKLRGECAKLYMELRDIDVQLDILKYRQGRCRRIYSVCVIVAVVILLIALFVGGVTLFYEREPIDGFAAVLVNGGIVVSALVGAVASTIFFSAMSVHSFWAQCANFLRIEKLEMQRLGCIREKSAIETRLANLEAEIAGHTEASITEDE